MSDGVPRMDWSADDQTSAIKLFKQRCELYFTIKDIKEEKQAHHILYFSGEQGLAKFNSWTLTEAQKKSPKEIWERFLGQPISTNFRVARFYLQQYRQQPRESIDEFVTRCLTQVKKCEFRDQEECDQRVIDQLVSGTRYPDLQKELLKQEKDMTLEQAIKLSKTHEASQEYAQQMTNATPSSVHSIHHSRNPQRACKFCGGQHPIKRREDCPAYNSECNACGKVGHWKSVCRSTRDSQGARPKEGRPRSHSRKRQRHTKRGQHKQSSVGTVTKHLPDSETEKDFSHLTLNSILKCDNISQANNRDEAVTHIMALIPGKKTIAHIRSKVDTGAQTNTLPVRMFRRMFPEMLSADGIPDETHVDNKQARLTAYNGTAITHYGSIVLQCRYKSPTWSPSHFFIVDSEGPAIIGLQSAETMSLVTMHCEISQHPEPAHNLPSVSSMKDLKQNYPDQFDRIGNFHGEYHITVDPDVQPVVHAARRCSIHLRNELKAELDDMERLRVIQKVTEPTDWVSSLAVSRKHNGKLRVCLDPKNLNKAIKRCHYKTPTVEELTYQLADAKYFSKMDAKNGYWSVKLDSESSRLTTFNTPFGRYLYLRMPFGLVMSQDVFQMKMDQVLERCPGTIGVADDVVVFGKSIEEHNTNLRNLMSVAQECGLVFNSEKCSIMHDQIKFFGTAYDKNGSHADPDKVADIQAIPAPMNKTELQEFLGIITYMGPFIPKLSEHTACLRDLLKREVSFEWLQNHDKAFRNLKELVCREITLSYFDTGKDTTIQVDASSRGIGAVLMQDGRPIAFASKSLSEAERRYANIERELLAVVFGSEKFHTYIYGKHFQVESDHKPLEMIQLKNLAAAPPRLQRMLLRLQNYDLHIKYRPGKELLLADGLSRLPIKQDPKSDHIELDLQINLVQFSTDRLNQLRTETNNDPTFRQLRSKIIEGWPEHRKDVPPILRPYWSFRDELSVENGLLLKGERVLIPTTMHKYILDKIHEGHQGIEKCRLRARECVHWIDINNDIEAMVKSCQICQENSKSQPAETLQQHEIPSRPWEILGTDLFKFEESEYLVIADYYSKFPFVRKMPKLCTSEAVIAASKQIFSEQGIPTCVMSDNGPQFASQSYQNFAESWGFDHKTSSPHYPRSNGFVERAIGTIKNVLTKAKADKGDLDKALLLLRTTPIDSHMPSPAELLNHRKMRGNLPIRIRNTFPNKDGVDQRLRDRQQSQKEYHDRHAKDLVPLAAGQEIRTQDHVTGRWSPGFIKSTCQEPRSYMVQLPSGSILRRNRRHILNIPQTHKAVTFAEDTDQEDQDTAQVPDDNHVAAENQNNINAAQVPGEGYTRFGRVVKKPNKLNL